jgi:multiple sugar transport system substrate-binding protein
MKRTKRILALLLSVLMVISLAGCKSQNSNDTTGGQESSEGSAEKKVITVWTNNRHDQEYMEKMVKEFNNSNDLGIEINYVIQTDNYVNMLTIAASSDQSPDLFSIAAADSIDLQSFVDSGIVAPITEYLSDTFKTVNEVDNVKYEGLNVIGEDIYWIPTGMRSGSRLIYNADLFAASGLEAPKTVEELVTAASTITKNGNGKEYGVIFPGLSSPFSRWLEGISQMSGVYAYDYAKGEFNFDGYKTIVEAVRKMFDEGSTFPGTASMKIDPIRAQFAEGNVGIHGNASQEAGVLTEQFPMKGNWAVADLPTYTGEVKGALAITPNFGWALSGNSKNKELAMKVIEYFGSEDFLKGYLEGGYSLPISDYMASKIDSSQTGRLADFALKDYEDVYPTIPAVTPEGEVWQDALWYACLTDGPDIDSTIEALNKSYNDALDKAVSMGKVKRLVIEDYNPLHPSQGTVTYLTK